MPGVFIRRPRPVEPPENRSDLLKGRSEVAPPVRTTCGHTKVAWNVSPVDVPAAPLIQHADSAQSISAKLEFARQVVRKLRPELNGDTGCE
jgi:hypothetical protein